MLHVQFSKMAKSPPVSLNFLVLITFSSKQYVFSHFLFVIEYKIKITS